MLNHSFYNVFSQPLVAMYSGDELAFSILKSIQRMEALNGHCGVRGRRDGTQGSLFWFAVPYRPDSNASLFYDEDKDEPIIAMKPALAHPSAASLNIKTSYNDVLHLEANTPVTVSWNNVTTSTSSIASLSQALSPMVRKRDGGLSPGSLRLKMQLTEQQKLRLGGLEQFQPLLVQLLSFPLCLLLTNSCPYCILLLAQLRRHC
jgi:hypothetical protein